MMTLLRGLLLVALVADVDTSVPAECPNVKFRGTLENSRAVFEYTAKGHVAFIGARAPARTDEDPVRDSRNRIIP